MYKISGRCPICGGSLRLERLRCLECSTALEGSFVLSPLFELEPEQLRFVELLVKHRGNIQRVAEELDVSYRTGRNRMDDIASALGYALPSAPPPPSPEKRREILEKLQEGVVKAEDAVRLLRGEDMPVPPVPPSPPAPLDIAVEVDEEE
jgi:hypothetical protein